MPPPDKGIGSVVSIVLYTLFAFIVLEKAQLTNVIANETFFEGAMWVNAIWRSKPERYTMAPVSMVLAGLCLVVALG